MILTKAIKIISAWSKLNCPPRAPDEIDALQLIIKAGEAIASDREESLYPFRLLLPGETGKK